MIRSAKGGYQDPADPGEPQTGEPRISVSDREAALLARLVSGLAVLEIGTGLGVSTRAIASTSPRVITVDIDPWVHETIWPTLPGNVQKLGGRPDPMRSIQAVFIDGDHDRHAALDDIRYATSFAELVIVHDTNYAAVRRATDSVGGFTYIETEHGLGVWFS